ncbi:MAG: hypothetical protein ACKOW9_03145 [Candidatus Paceibacterota bacterium]
MKQKEREKRYVPYPVYLQILKTNYKRKDDLYIIIDAIYRRQIYFKSDTQKYYGYVEIPRKYFRELIGNNNNVSKALDFLLDNKWIESNDFYRIGLQCKGYRLPSNFLGKRAVIEIEDDKINDRLRNLRLAKRKKRAKNIEFQKSKYFKMFDIDLKPALQATEAKAIEDLKILANNNKIYINEHELKQVVNSTPEGLASRNKFVSKVPIDFHNILHRFMVQQEIVSCIADGYLFFKRDKNTGRATTNLCSLPSYLRQYIKSDKTLMNIDIANSQSYFLYTLLINEPTINKLELEQYGKLATKGLLYEYLSDNWNNNYNRRMTREQMKKVVCKIFYSKTESFKMYKEFFGSYFPTIMDYINATNFQVHNTLALELMNRESNIVLDTVLPDLNEIGIVPFTIHDSFLVHEDEVNTVKKTIKDICINKYGVAPELHETTLFESSEEDDQESWDEFLLSMESMEFEEVKETDWNEFFAITEL